jgi:predicted enzyme related to lactoylglutathione lyase
MATDALRVTAHADEAHDALNFDDRGNIDMAAPPIGSLLVGSTQPDAMKLWYERAFDVSQNAMGAFEFGPVQLFIETHSDVADKYSLEPARIIVNFDVDDCRALVRHLKDLGTRFVRDIEAMPFGLIATARDPDGNYIQLIEWGAGSDTHHTG